jgi:hypothetical protein
MAFRKGNKGRPPEKHPKRSISLNTEMQMESLRLMITKRPRKDNGQLIIKQKLIDTVPGVTSTSKADMLLNTLIERGFLERYKTSTVKEYWSDKDKKVIKQTVKELSVWYYKVTEFGKEEMEEYFVEDDEE